MAQERNVLKIKFERGKKPTEVDYADLIDSFVNKIDDSYYKSDDLPEADANTKGIVARASITESNTGSNTEKFVTPAGVKSAIETLTPAPPVTSVNGDTGVVTIPDYTKDDTAWNVISLLTGTTNTIGTSSARYRRKTGVVFLEGELTISSSNLGDTDLFILNPNYRPSRNVIFYTLASTGTMVRIQIDTGGAVVATNVDSNSGAVNISLSGILFIV